ncbi:hypothetical protein J1N35_030112 [Gossypium stocksii]|uniref:Reverse transcriptase domain-containing protein n=1 Tax=Gossypium stocksii TaxID=47602 RepID=A0A9D3ZU22_9ROSI|nr:hypothetical protein J1N35_030112 [Gossypium stocksii]
MLWAPKSRVNWIVKGKCNTEFFHITTMVRCSHNKIMGLNDNLGNWIADRKGVENIVQNYFMELFCTNQSTSTLIPANPDSPWPSLSTEEQNYLLRPISKTEISKAVGPFKAPRNDGTLFLLPNMLMITKIMVARNEIDPPKDNFPISRKLLLGRHTCDNAIIVQEVMHSLRHMKRKKWVMIIKLDLKEAYDKLEWSFIRKVLHYFNFPRRSIDLIMHCITSASTSIQLNGSKLKKVQPSRGIR